MKTLYVVLAVIFAVTTGIFGWLYAEQKSSAQKIKTQADSTVAFAQKWLYIRDQSRAYQDSGINLYAGFNKGTTAKNNPFSDPQRAADYIGLFKPGTVNGTANSQTNSVWVSKKAIADLMHFLTVQTVTDGVRVYFSQYPEILKFPDPLRTDNNAYDFMNTLVFVATKPGTLAMKHTNYYGKSPYFDMGDRVYWGIFNYHDLCPPNTNCEPFDATSGDNIVLIK
jgi:hypothetical protein